MISLAECAPCKAMRLQKESEEEFRKRYGMIDLNKPALQMGWRPYLGQMPAQPVYPVTTPEPAEAPSPYFRNVQERLLNFSGGALFGFPIGILGNVAFKSLRRYRSEAATFVALASGVGLVVALLPIESQVMPVIARVAGLLAGSGLSDIVLPRKMAPLPA